MILSVPLRQQKQEQNASCNIKFLMKNNCTIKKFRTIQKVRNNQMFDQSYFSYLFKIKTSNKIEILRGGGCCSSCSNCMGYNNNNTQKNNEQQTSRQCQNSAWIEQFLNKLFEWTARLKLNQLEDISKIFDFQKSYIIIDEFTQQNQLDTDKFPNMNNWVDYISSLLKRNEINGYIRFQLLIICNQFILQSSLRKFLGNELINNAINIFEQENKTNEIIFWQIPIEYEISFLKYSLYREKTIQNQSQPQFLSLFSDQSLPQNQGASVSKDFEIYKIKCTFQNQLLSFLNQIQQQNHQIDIKNEIKNLFQWFDTNIKFSLNTSVQYYWMKFIIDLITFCAIDIYEMKNEEDKNSIEKGNKIIENKETNENFQIQFGIRQLQQFLSSPMNKFEQEKKKFNLYSLISHIQNVDQKIKQHSNYLFNKLFKRFLHLYLQISNNSYQNNCSKKFQSLLFEIIYLLNEIDQCITMTWAKLIKIKVILQDQFDLREKLNTINEVEKSFKELYKEFTKNYQDITLYWLQQLIKLHENQNNQEQLKIDQSFQIEINKSIQILDKILQCLNQDLQDKLKFDSQIELNFRYTFFQQSSIHGIEFQWFFVKFIEILIQEFEKIIGKDKNKINNSIIQVVLDSLILMIRILKLLSNQLEFLKSKMDSSQNIDKFNDIKNRIQIFQKDFQEKIQDKITSTDEAKAQEFQLDLNNLLVKSCMFQQNQIQEINTEKDKIINLINEISNQDDSTKNERKKEIFRSQGIIIDIINNQQKSYNDSENRIDLMKKKIHKLIENLNQIITISYQYCKEYQNNFKVDIQYFFDNLQINLKQFKNDFNLCFITLLDCNFNTPEIKSTIQLIQKQDIQNMSQDNDKLNFQVIRKIRQIFNNQDSFLDDQLGYFLINASNLVTDNEFQEKINKIINQTRISDKKKRKLKQETQLLQEQIQTQMNVRQKEIPINGEEIKNFFNTIFSSKDE